MTFQRAHVPSSVANEAELGEIVTEDATSLQGTGGVDGSVEKHEQVPHVARRMHAAATTHSLHSHHEEGPHVLASRFVFLSC